MIIFVRREVQWEMILKLIQHIIFSICIIQVANYIDYALSDRMLVIKPGLGISAVKRHLLEEFLLFH